MILLLSLLLGCGVPPRAVLVEDESDDVLAPVMTVRGRDSGSEPDATPDLVEDMAATRGTVDSLRCYLLHESESAPRGWKRPGISAYEDAEDPCSLMPGFVDPKKMQQEALDELQEQLKVQEQSAPASMQ